MVETLQNLQHVYAKWETRNPFLRQPGEVRRQGDDSNSNYNSMLDAGRATWNSRFSAAGLPPPKPSRRRGNRGNRDQVASSLGVVSAVALGGFKTAPTVHPLTGRLRPYMGRCCTCMHHSREEFFNSSISNQGLQNILSVTEARSNNWLTRRFCNIVHSLRRKVDYSYPDVSLAVLTSERVKEAIQKVLSEQAGESDTPQRRVAATRREKRRAERVMARMRAAISNTLIRLTGWFLLNFLGRLLSSICVHQGQMELLRRAHQKKVPVIMLPTHRSHLDYILITFILFCSDIKAPHVAAGDNLIIPVFGRLLRGLGGYFIRRKIDKYGKKDHIYRAVLHNYMLELLRQGENFEFYIEGGRTRSGKALLPKAGLLSVIVDAYMEDIIPDAMIVPISISYDKLLDGDFTNEQMGQPKKKETFWGAIRSIWGVLTRHYGAVRVDFAQPFSLKEYLTVANTFSSSGSSQQLSQLLPARGGSTGSPPRSPDHDTHNNKQFLHSMSSTTSLYGTDCVIEEMRTTVQGLAEHIVYSQVTSQAVMATNLLAFILLYKYPQGATLSVVHQLFDWLRAEVHSRRRDLGFSGTTPDAVAAAADMHADVIRRETRPRKQGDNSSEEEEEEEVVLRPVTTLPQVFVLSYYANAVTTVFCVESVIANAVHASVPGDLWMTSTESFITVSRDRILNHAVFLCQLLKYEFIFTPPCTPLLAALTDAIDQLIAAEVLVTHSNGPGGSEDPAGGSAGSGDPTEQAWAARLSRSVAMDTPDSSDDDDDVGRYTDMLYKVQTSCSLEMERFQFLRAVIAPLLEAYYILACHLTLIEENSMEEKEFISTVHQQLKLRVKNGVATFPDSCALDTVRNGLHGLEHVKVVDTFRGREGDAATPASIRLNPRYRGEKLTEFIASLEAYRS